MKYKFLVEYYLSPFSEPLIWYILCCTNFFFFVFCYGAPPAIHKAGCRISFGIWVIPAERQTARAPQCCHTVTLWSLYPTPAVIPGQLLLCPKPAVGLWAQGAPAPASASTLVQLSAKDLGSHSKPGADAFKEMGTMSIKKMLKALTSKLNAIITMSNTGEARDGNISPWKVAEYWLLVQFLTAGTPRYCKYLSAHTEFWSKNSFSHGNHIPKSPSSFPPEPLNSCTYAEAATWPRSLLESQ